MLKRIFIGLSVASLVACSAQPGKETVAKQENMETAKEIEALLTIVPEVNFKASDGETVFADIHYGLAEDDMPVIILFHQAGSNGRGEYAKIWPKLHDHGNGYNVLVVDQRSGGDYFGSDNRTVAARGGKTTYCPAYADMEGALSFAKARYPDSKIFAWGSSYSAALVLKLASEHGDDLAGIISFSPATGGPMGECNANNFINAVNIPALGIRPDSEMGKNDAALKEFGAGYAQKAMYEKQGLNYFISIDGVHGASMLDPSRAKGDVAPTWKAVWAFMDKHK